MGCPLASNVDEGGALGSSIVADSACGGFVALWPPQLNVGAGPAQEQL